MLQRMSKVITPKTWASVISICHSSGHKAETAVQENVVNEKAPDKEETGEKPTNIRVTIVGGAGRIGSTVALLLKQSPWLDTLAVHDIDKKTCGVAMDISHIDTKCRVLAFVGEDQLCESMKDSHIVVVCAGKRLKSGRSENDIFKENAKILKSVCQEFAKACPDAFMGIVSQPINSLVPVATEILKAEGKHDPKKIFGISSLDVVRATTFVSEALDVDPAGVVVPVVGGHSEKTIVPILSQAKPCTRLPVLETCEIIRLVKKSSSWVYEMKDQKDSAVLAPAFATARFVNNLIKAISGQAGVFDCAYINTDVAQGVSYCTVPIELCSAGVKKARLPVMCTHETEVLQDALCELRQDISRGEKFAISK